MAAVAVPAALSLYSMYQQGQQQKHQNDLLKKGTDAQAALDAEKLGNLKNIEGLANGYDPATVTAQALKSAQETAGATLESSLRNLSANYRSGGGVPGLSTDFLQKSADTANRVLDPLKTWAADQVAGETQRKANLFAMAAGAAPGSVGDEYFKAASMTPQYSGAGSASMLQAAIQQYMTMQGKKTAGSGGSGDTLMWTNPNAPVTA